MNRITTVATSAAFQPIGMIGKVGPEPEEVEAEGAEAADSSLEARLAKVEAEADSPFTETELAERERTFQYLKEFRECKRLERRLEREDGATEKASAEVERILREDAQRSSRESEGIMSEETVMENTDVGIGYIEDENGKLTKRRTTVLRRTPTRRKTPTAKGDSAPRQFIQADRERVNRNRVRYTRAAWGRELRAFAEGRLHMTKEQFQAFIAYGRFRGWNRRAASKR